MRPFQDTNLAITRYRSCPLRISKGDIDIGSGLAPCEAALPEWNRPTCFGHGEARRDQ